MCIMRKNLRLLLVICLFLLPVSGLAMTGAEAAGIRSVSVIAQESDGRTTELELYRGSHALLVGVSDYTAGWPDLESVPGKFGDSHR